MRAAQRENGARAWGRLKREGRKELVFRAGKKKLSLPDVIGDNFLRQTSREEWARNLPAMHSVAACDVRRTRYRITLSLPSSKVHSPNFFKSGNL